MKGLLQGIEAEINLVLDVMLPAACNPIPYALETDWPVGAAGFEPLHLEIRSAELHPAWGGFRRRSGAPLIRDGARESSSPAPEAEKSGEY